MKLKNKLKICIFVDTDIAVRHFIKTGAFKEINKNHDIIYVFNKDTSSLKPATYTDPKSLGLKKIRFTSVTRKRMGQWFPLYMATVIRQQKGTPNYKARIADAKYQSGKAFILKSYFRGLPFIYNIYKYYILKKLKIDKSVISVIKNEKPDIILHPSILQGYYINELLLIKQKYNIPLILLMNSWDNPSAKAVCSGLPSKLAVWGEQSKQHAKTYLRLNDKKISVLGAAQFQTYRTKTKYSKNELCKFFNVPKNKTILVYAGAGSGIHETKHLQALESAIEKKVLVNTHVIYRPHPWRGGLGEGEIDFFSLFFNHITMDPHMESYYREEIKNPTRKVFMIDYKISNRLLTLVDGLISPLSTMLVEAITLGKPVLVFFPNEYKGKIFSTDEIHFSEFIKIKDVVNVFKFDDFHIGLKKLYKNIGNQTVSKNLKEESKFFHILDKKSYSHKLNKLVLEVFNNE